MDLIVGASILIAIVILITGVLWLKEVSVSRRMVDYGVLFPNVGTLQVGDPVMLNGVTKGSVKSIALRAGSVAVILEIDRDVRITDSCRITVQNIGLMGERGVGLHYTESGSVITPISGADTVFLHGGFDTGIAEAMGMLGEVLGEVKTLASNVSSIVDQTVGDTSFITVFKEIVARLDTVLIAAQGLIGDNSAAIERSVANLEVLTRDARSLLSRNGPSIDSIVSHGEELTERALLVVDKIDTLAVSANTLLGRIQSEESSIGKLIRDKDLYSELKQTVADIDTLVRSVQDDALKLRIKLGFGKKRQ